jgi:hypothetical protein
MFEVQEAGLNNLQKLLDGSENVGVSGFAMTQQFAVFADFFVDFLTSAQVDMLSTDIEAEDYNAISEMIGNLKERVINSVSYKK